MNGRLIKTVELPNLVRLPYVEQGDSSGIPIVFLHGYADSWRSFGRMLSHLPSSIHAFAPSQRGHGDATRPVAGYRTRDFVADLAAFMDSLDMQIAVIAGGSSGGFVARRFAIDFPSRTLGLVLLGSPFTLNDKPGVLNLWRSSISNLTDPVTPAFVREFQKGTVAQPVPQAFLQTMVEESVKVPARVWKETFEGLLQDDSSDDLDKIRMPTLIVWGDQDAIIPRSDQDRLATAIAGSKLVVYEGAGHSVYWEEPERVASDLVAFVENLR